MKSQRQKGSAAEETLRNYFLSIGYYVARGVKFSFGKFDVTDIDLWLYSRNSPISRERVCVDIKNKKTPQALERILWTKGLQSVLRLDSCIVATTDSRPAVREFGLQNNVLILDGKFLARLTTSARGYQERIKEEDFLYDLESGSIGRLGGDWRNRYENSKSRLLTSLSFDGCNAWLKDIEYAFTQIASGNPSALRFLYAICSHFFIAMDYILKELISDDYDQRQQKIENGIRYGASGKDLTEKISKMASALIESISAQPGLAETLRHEMKKESDNVKANILAEYFSKNLTGASIYETARVFESLAFAPQVPFISTQSAQIQGIIGVLADFCGIDRKVVLK